MLWNCWQNNNSPATTYRALFCDSCGKNYNTATCEWRKSPCWFKEAASRCRLRCNHRERGLEQSRRFFIRPANLDSANQMSGRVTVPS